MSYKLCKILFAEHIVLEFAECIISCFDVFANGEREMFAELLRFCLRFEDCIYFSPILMKDTADLCRNCLCHQNKAVVIRVRAVHRTAILICSAEDAFAVDVIDVLIALCACIAVGIHDYVESLVVFLRFFQKVGLGQNDIRNVGLCCARACTISSAPIGPDHSADVFRERRFADDIVKLGGGNAGEGGYIEEL